MPRTVQLPEKQEVLDMLCCINDAHSAFIHAKRAERQEETQAWQEFICECKMWFVKHHIICRFVPVVNQYTLKQQQKRGRTRWY